MKKISLLKKAIIIISCIILIIIVIFIIMLYQKETTLPQDREILEKGNHVPTSFEKEIVTDHSTFFSVGNAIQDYLNSISFNIEDISL